MMDLRMVKELSESSRLLVTLELGGTISRKVTDRRSTLMALLTRENTRAATNTEKADSPGPMALTTKENSSIL